MERPTHLTEEAVRNRGWIPMRAGKNGTNISLLLFADDLFIFTEASVCQMDNILQILDRFCCASGHSINRGKTSIFLF